MNEDFVAYELAKKLDEKGFNEPCYGYYHRDGGNDSFELCGNGDCDFLNSKNKHRVAAPTISQVLKWLREERFIFIGLSPMPTYDSEEMVEWRSAVYKTDKQGGLSCQEEFYFQSYEHAALAGIEYVLDNLIKL
jgi:hypothetical protein